MFETAIKPSATEFRNRSQFAIMGENLVAMARAWLSGEGNWRPPEEGCAELCKLARKHGVDGLAGALVSTGTPFPEDIGNRAFASYCTNTVRYQQASLVCRQVRDAAQANAIPLSFVKGPALASAYGDDGVRGFGDIDVLVRNGDDALRLAALCGFAIPPGAQEIPSSIGRRLRNVGRIEVTADAFTIELTSGNLPAHEALHSLYRHWPERYLLPAKDSEPFPIPDVEAHLLFLLQHLALHWGSRLIWLIDFAVLMRRRDFDSDWLEYAAEKIEMRRLLRAVTGFCRHHLDESIAELGRGPVGWKDGLFLNLISPEGLVTGSFHKYNKDPIPRMPDFFLSLFQHVFATDLLYPSGSIRDAGPRWIGQWFQYFMWPGGRGMALVARWTTPLFCVWMTVWIWVLIKQSPLALLRFGRRELSDPCDRQGGDAL